LHENGLLELFTSVYGANLASEANDGGKNNVLHRNTYTMMNLFFNIFSVQLSTRSSPSLLNILKATVISVVM